MRFMQKYSKKQTEAGRQIDRNNRIKHKAPQRCENAKGLCFFCCFLRASGQIMPVRSQSFFRRH